MDARLDDLHERLLLSRRMRFSYEYSQPNDYHFCQDSVLTPRLIAEDLLKWSKRPAKLNALDACAGCGVLGFELLHVIRDSIGRFDFLEVQTEFAPHFRANREITNTLTLPIDWVQTGYSILQTPEFTDRYDLIISNPPYFEKNEGTLSASDLNNRARFFLDDSLSSLLKGFRNALKPGGRAYFLMKSGKKHGRDAFTSARLELYDCDLERLADVRGTDLIKMACRQPTLS